MTLVCIWSDKTYPNWEDFSITLYKRWVLQDKIIHNDAKNQLYLVVISLKTKRFFLDLSLKLGMISWSSLNEVLICSGKAETSSNVIRSLIQDLLVDQQWCCLSKNMNKIETSIASKLQNLIYGVLDLSRWFHFLLIIFVPTQNFTYPWCHQTLIC